MHYYQDQVVIVIKYETTKCITEFSFLLYLQIERFVYYMVDCCHFKNIFNIYVIRNLYIFNMSASCWNKFRR